MYKDGNTPYAMAQTLSYGLVISKFNIFMTFLVMILDEAPEI
jgi:hypothetical protein